MKKGPGSKPGISVAPKVFELRSTVIFHVQFFSPTVRLICFYSGKFSFLRQVVHHLSTCQV